MATLYMAKRNMNQPGYGKFGYQPTIQYEFPVKLFTIRDNNFYI